MCLYKNVLIKNVFIQKCTYKNVFIQKCTYKKCVYTKMYL